VLTSDFGQQVDDFLSWVDPEPLAAASVAQVHAARLSGGTDVVVKIQRPGIADVVERDLDILFRLARTLESRTHWARSLWVSRNSPEALRTHCTKSLTSPSTATTCT
jgi:ubiquinone biosynthesis protein